MRRALSPCFGDPRTPARKRSENASEHGVRPLSGFTVATETSSFAASLVAQARSAARDCWLSCCSDSSRRGGLAVHRSTSLARRPSAQLAGRTLPGISDAIAAATR
jgi:hypothetical protein